jgi:hypothetical protein
VRLSSKKTITKKGWWSGSRLGPEFKPSTTKKDYSGILDLNNFLIKAFITVSFDFVSSSQKR